MIGITYSALNNPVVIEKYHSRFDVELDVM